MEPTVTLVDSNVLIDIFSHDTEWGAWSRDALAQAMEAGSVAINAIIYAEVGAGFSTREDLDDALEGLDRIEMPWIAGFLAGQVFRQYRDRGGSRTAILPDFLIGAHAAVAGLRLLTRDAARYRSYFPTIVLIAPA